MAASNNTSPTMATSAGLIATSPRERELGAHRAGFDARREHASTARNPSVLASASSSATNASKRTAANVRRTRPSWCRAR